MKGLKVEKLEIFDINAQKHIDVVDAIKVKTVIDVKITDITLSSNERLIVSFLSTTEYDDGFVGNIQIKGALTVKTNTKITFDDIENWKKTNVLPNGLINKFIHVIFNQLLGIIVFISNKMQLPIPISFSVGDIVKDGMLED